MRRCVWAISLIFSPCLTKVPYRLHHCKAGGKCSPLGAVGLAVRTRQAVVTRAERRRVAHELHDEAGQLLASGSLALEATGIGPPPEEPLPPPLATHCRAPPPGFTRWQFRRA